jgi:hypothetical protein
VQYLLRCLPYSLLLVSALLRSTYSKHRQFLTSKLTSIWQRRKLRLGEALCQLQLCGPGLLGRLRLATEWLRWGEGPRLNAFRLPGGFCLHTATIQIQIHPRTTSVSPLASKG